MGRAALLAVTDALTVRRCTPQGWSGLTIAVVDP